MDMRTHPPDADLKQFPLFLMGVAFVGLILLVLSEGQTAFAQARLVILLSSIMVASCVAFLVAKSVILYR